MREDFRHKWEDNRQRWEKRWEQRSRHGHIWTGIFILLVGVAALVKASVTDLPDWVFSWQMFLIALGVFIGIKHGFRGPSWLILIAIGGIFLLRDLYPDMAIKRYIWPMILIMVGIILIIRPRSRRCMPDGQKKNMGGEVSGDTIILDDQVNSREDFVDSTSVFSGTKKKIITKTFRGGDIVNIFGGTELDLTQADMTRTATLEITTIFGGTKLIIPSNWEIQSEVVNIFGGIEDKRKNHTGNLEPEKILRLKGNVFFGGIEIKSY